MCDVILYKLYEISICARYDLCRMAPILAPKVKMAPNVRNGAKSRNMIYVEWRPFWRQK